MALGTLEVSSYPWKIIHNCLHQNYYLLYYPTLKLQCLDACWGYFTIFFRGARSNTLSPFPEDRRFITLTSSNEDGIIFHDLRNLVSDRSE